jgi:hypothetical protein
MNLAKIIKFFEQPHDFLPLLQDFEHTVKKRVGDRCGR